MTRSIEEACALSHSQSVETSQSLQSDTLETGNLPVAFALCQSALMKESRVTLGVIRDKP